MPSVTRLARRLAKTPKITVNDGLCGALVLPDMFLTSPNCEYLPEPPLGSTRDLYRRRDGRYGPDDFLNHPQPFNAKYPFYAAILKEPRDGDSSSMLMWSNLTEYSVESSPGSPNDGIVKADVLDKFRVKVSAQKARVRSHISSNKTNRQAFLNEMSTNIDTCLLHLATRPSSLRILQVGLTEVQRAYLAIDAVMHFEQQLEKSQTSREPLEVDQTRMGAFVWDARDAIGLFNAGYPVFALRYWRKFSSQIVILKVVSLTPPMVESSPADPPFPPILTSQAGSENKFAAIRWASINCFTSASPFENQHRLGAYQSSYNIGQGRITSPVFSPPSASTFSALPASSSRVNRHRHPNDKVNVKKNSVNRKLCFWIFFGAYNSQYFIAAPKQSRDIFDDLPTVSQLVPPAVPAWIGANKTIDRRGVTAQKKMLEVPDAALFFGLEDMSRQDPYLYQWAHLRDPWLQRCTGRHSAQTVDTWRKVLSYRLLPSLEPGSIAKNNNNSAAIVAARKLVEETIRMYSPSMSFTPEMNGPFPAPEARRLIRELCMTNFRSELIYVDELLDQSSPQPAPNVSVDQLTVNLSAHRRQRMTLIDECFGGGGAVIIEDLNLGLTSDRWADRYGVLKYFWSLMNTWPGQKPSTWRRGYDLDLTLLQHTGEEWERMLAVFYVQSAYNTLGCPPSLPRRL